MTDLFFSYNTSYDVTKETKVQFLWNLNNDGWTININNEKTTYKLDWCVDDDDMWYELSDGNTFLKTFNFDGQTVRYLPNLIQVYQHIVEHSIEKGKVTA